MNQENLIPHGVNQDGWVDALGELQTGEWQETWWAGMAGMTQGKGIFSAQHYSNTAGHHAGCPSVLPGTLIELKRSSPITLGAKCKARNANHLLDRFPSHCSSLQYEQLEVFKLFKL